MEFELSRDCGIEEIAGGLSGLCRANAAFLARPEHSSRRARLSLLKAIQALPYNKTERPDRGSTIARMIENRRADCEDFMAALWALLKALRGEGADVQGLLTYGGSQKQLHAFNRVNGRVHDRAVLNGMDKPPGGIYTDPRLVVVAA